MNCMCEGCGAPLQLHAAECAWCKRLVSGQQFERLDVTTLEDVAPRYVFGARSIKPEVLALVADLKCRADALSAAVKANTP